MRVWSESRREGVQYQCAGRPRAEWCSLYIGRQVIKWQNAAIRGTTSNFKLSTYLKLGKELSSQADTRTPGAPPVLARTLGSRKATNGPFRMSVWHGADRRYDVILLQFHLSFSDKNCPRTNFHVNAPYLVYISESKDTWHLPRSEWLIRKLTMALLSMSNTISGITAPDFAKHRRTF